MIDYNFTDDKIIKALECCEKGCACTSCPLEDDYSPCSSSMAHLALSLINKQNAEIETLKDNNEHLAVILEETKAEVEKLQNELVIWKQNRFNLFQRLECYEMARQKLASEIFAEIETLLALNILVGDVFTGKYFDADFENDIAELKKKYTEETK